VQNDLQEGYYWLDRQIVRAYDKQGNIYKILRVYTDDELNITFKYYQNKKFEIESWVETINRNKDRLISLEKESLSLIKQSLLDFKCHKPIIFTSGGKDSNLTMQLVRNIDNNIGGLFNNTSLDCADTYKAIKQVDNTYILNPEEGFYQWRKRLEFIPTRFARACCSKFKEGETSKYLNKKDDYLIFMGMRNEESNTRSGYEDLYSNPKWDTDTWQGVLPIRKWTEEEVWLYTMWKDIPINDKYKKGYARVGCAIACPFYAKSTWILDKYWYPIMYERWQNILKEDFIDNYKWTRMNCTLEEYKTNWNGGLVRKEPTQEVIEEFARNKEINVSLAEKYFNHKCEECNKNVNKKDVIAMNMKLISRNTEIFYCKKHLREKFDLSNDKWDEYVKSFKIQECDLF